MTGVAGGAAASQVPTFPNAYLIYLQGRVDEAARAAAIAQEELTRAGETMGVSGGADALKAALAQGSSLADAALARSVAAWEGLIERASWLQDTIATMAAQQPFERLLKLPLNMLPEFVQGTMRNFEPGFAFTIESAVIVLASAIVAYFVARVIARLFWALVRPARGTPAED